MSSARRAALATESDAGLILARDMDIVLRNARLGKDAPPWDIGIAVGPCATSMQGRFYRRSPTTGECHAQAATQSGLGREGAHEGLMEFLETQYVSVTW